MQITSKQSDKGAKTSEIAGSRYVRLYWVIGWGLRTGVLLSILMAVAKGWEHLPIFFILAMIGLPIGGCFLGQWMSKFAERSLRPANHGG